MPRGNPSPKLALTTLTAREALQRRQGLAAVAEWEKQHGSLTQKEMEEARRRVRTHLRDFSNCQAPAKP